MVPAKIPFGTKIIQCLPWVKGQPDTAPVAHDQLARVRQVISRRWPNHSVKLPKTRRSTKSEEPGRGAACGWPNEVRTFRGAKEIFNEAGGHPLLRSNRWIGRTLAITEAA